MNVNRTGLEGLFRIYENLQKKVEKNRTERGENRAEDSVSLSSDALEIKKALGYASKVSEIRQEKVARLKEQIQKGTYNVEGRLIAEKMLEDYRKGRLI
ncbi:MAG: flagellar biosynthesis anti-sigma factor FlgM [Bacillota bacterium]